MKLGNNIVSLFLAAFVLAGSGCGAISTTSNNDNNNNDSNASFVVQIRTPDATAHPDQACQREPQINIHQTLHEALVGTVDDIMSGGDDTAEESSGDAVADHAGDDHARRSLSSRFGGMSWYCYSVCKNFPRKGTCFDRTGV
jgi:hypothetical protein